MTRDGSKHTPKETTRVAAIEKKWLERGGVIAKGDPKAPPPKAPSSGSGAFTPGSTGSAKK